MKSQFKFIVLPTRNFLSTSVKNEKAQSGFSEAKRKAAASYEECHGINKYLTV